MVLVIDHYDSFIDMICDYILQLGYDPVVIKTDQITENMLAMLSPSHLLIGPGPGHPKDQDLEIVNQLITDAIAREIPILGICLGHQLIAEYFGLPVDRADCIAHGKVSEIQHDTKGLFKNIPTPIKVARYHSLLVTYDGIKESKLEVAATTLASEIMAIRHKTLPIFGLQFHPESIMTQYGKELLANFFSI